MSEKTDLERAALDGFLETYNRLNETHLEFKEHCDKPDFVVKDSLANDEVGIEVKHLYYDQEESQMLFGRSKNPVHGTMNSGSIIARLNGLLKEACERAQKYDFSKRVLLIVRVASPVFEKDTFDYFEKDITVPPNIFSGIWLVFRDSNRETWTNLKKLK